MNLTPERIAAALLALFTIAIGTPHPLCATMPCAGLSCHVWAIEPLEPGGHVQADPLRAATCRWTMLMCTEAGPVAEFEVTERTSITGFKIRQHFQDGTYTDDWNGEVGVNGDH